MRSSVGDCFTEVTGRFGGPVLIKLNQTASTWTSTFPAREIPSKGSLVVEKETTGCEGTENNIRYLEHVEVVLSLTFTRRGDLAIYLTSPRGTRSTLLGKRNMDYSSKGFKDWAFMSTHTWEENPKGKWKLEIQNVGRSWKMVLINRCCSWDGLVVQKPRGFTLD